HDDDRDRLWEEIQDSVAARCTGLGLRLVVEEVHAAPACRCDGRLRGALAAGSAAAGAGAAPELLSWAGHDAMAVAAVTPVGMLFVRCADGISHHPAERVDVADVALAIDAMEAAVLDLAQGPGAR
ncbi:MAG: M20/M25/M40 family metallo-hydrolase, partial [Kineosporiaceae bacterium]